jgi:hypothetical protein
MKRTIIKGIFLVSLSATSVFAQNIKGYVYHDENGNGKRDRKEVGLANVAVSNGVEVVKTDNQGSYSLPKRETQIVFVIKPSGYQSPLNQDNQPVNYYINKPNGSPADFKYAGSKPTGNLPASLDFPLVKVNESDEFRVLVFGDPQPYTQQEVDFFEKDIVDEVVGIKNVAFGLSLGDLVGNDLSLHSPYIKAVKKIGLPWYNLLGNHDLNFDAKVDSLSDETFEANFGPANYALNYGKVHFIVLDDVIYPDPRDGKGYWGGFREDQFKFIENDLKHVSKDQLIVLAFHIPLLNGKEDVEGNSFRMKDRNRLFALLKDFPYTLSLSAHTHLQRQNFYGKADGWLQEKPHHEYNAGTTSGDWYSGELKENGTPSSTMRDGTPKGYAFLNLKGNQYSIDYKVAGKEMDYQMEVFVPKVVEKRKNTSAGIFANFFMGAEGDEVVYAVDGKKWIRMTYMETMDPKFVSTLVHFDEAEKLLSGRRPSNAEASTHLWRGNIPANLKPGRHEIEVKATDRYGRTYSQKVSYVIEERK